jgi:hypothetical protein
MSEDKALCGALLKRCQGCNHKYTKDDTANGVASCPECGRARGRCSHAALPGTGRCKLHGGMSPGGLASARYQGRGYSRYLPQRVLADYQHAMDDPALGEMTSELALIEARMSEVIRQLGTGESGSGWRNARAQMTQLIATLQAAQPDPIAQAQAVQALRDTIHRGFEDVMLWDELRTLIESKRRIVETEQKRIVNGKMYLTLDKAGLLIDALTNSVAAHVADRSILAAIQRDWTKYLGVLGDAGQPQLDEADSRE